MWGLVWAKGKLRVPLTSALSSQTISSPSTVLQVAFQMRSCNRRLRGGMGEGYSQGKDWNLDRTGA